MALQTPIEYDQASPAVKSVCDDIMTTRKTDWVNNFWKVLANHPQNLQRIWSNIKQVMGNGALDPLTKELIYVAVSITNNCGYCIASHSAGARAKGMTDEQFGEVLVAQAQKLVIGGFQPSNLVAVFREHRYSSKTLLVESCSCA
jgi:AhpD family alkylhydroperoxidase